MGEYFTNFFGYDNFPFLEQCTFWSASNIFGLNPYALTAVPEPMINFAHVQTCQATTTDQFTRLCKYIGDYGHLFSKVSNLNVFGIELELLQ
jgi:hypothetical protein